MPSLHIEDIPYIADSSAAFECILDLPNPVFLDSAAPYSKQQSLDIISAAPLTLIRSEIASNTNSYNSKLTFFDRLNNALKECLPPLAERSDCPFSGGAIGYFGYELGHELEKLPKHRKTSTNAPGAIIGIYSWALITDHAEQRTQLAFRSETSTELKNEIIHRFRQPPASSCSNFSLLTPPKSNMTEADYRTAFNRIKESISAGDCYQINLTQQFQASYSGSPFDGYKLIRKTAAAPFSAFLGFEDNTVMSFSPERFIKLEGRHVLTSPIKGTAARSIDKSIDTDNARKLQDSAKNRAENLMIVDLLRNDLGRSCKAGSIKVDQLFSLESFNTVHHLVSHISGELEDGISALELLQNCFPGGSITGAPKVKAMEIIDKLERHQRGVYCGAIGYIDANGNMDTSIAIRTMLCKGDQLYCWSGGGIVADSDCAEEFLETQIKVEKLFKAIESTTSHDALKA